MFDPDTLWVSCESADCLALSSLLMLMYGHTRIHTHTHIHTAITCNPRKSGDNPGYIWLFVTWVSTQELCNAPGIGGIICWPGGQHADSVTTVQIFRAGILVQKFKTDRSNEDCTHYKCLTGWQQLQTSYSTMYHLTSWSQFDKGLTFLYLLQLAFKSGQLWDYYIYSYILLMYSSMYSVDSPRIPLKHFCVNLQHTLLGALNSILDFTFCALLHWIASRTFFSSGDCWSVPSSQQGWNVCSFAQPLCINPFPTGINHYVQTCQWVSLCQTCFG